MVFGEFMSGENFNDTGVRHLSGFFGLRMVVVSRVPVGATAGGTASIAVHPDIGRL